MSAPRARSDRRDRHELEFTAVLAADTSREAERVQIGLWRRMSPLDKARAATEISRVVQELSLLGIRQRHPGGSEREWMLRLAVLKLGRELAGRAYPEAAALLGA